LLAGRRMPWDGVLVIDAQCLCTQEQNRQGMLDRLVELIRRAAEKPAPYRKTRPALASQVRLLEARYRRSQTKRLRWTVSYSED